MQNTKLDSFDGQLSSYKAAIEADVAVYADYLRTSTREHYGDFAADLEIDVFLDVLSRGGKRIRGALVMCGYEMCGGTNKKMIVQAARAIEMLHAYILIVDDIQDRSTVCFGSDDIYYAYDTVFYVVTDQLLNNSLSLTLHWARIREILAKP